MQLNLDFEDFNRVTNALNRLAEYEETGFPPTEIADKFEEIKSQEDYIVGLNGLTDKFCEVMNKINNIAVEWQECGPYENTNTIALEKMMEIEKLSRLSVKIEGEKND